MAFRNLPQPAEPTLKKYETTAVVLDINRFEDDLHTDLTKLIQKYSEESGLEFTRVAYSMQDILRRTFGP